MEIRAKTASHLEEMKKRVVRDSEATSLELLLDARRANLSGAHLNVSTTLLKKINRHTSKEKMNIFTISVCGLTEHVHKHFVFPTILDFWKFSADS